MRKDEDLSLCTTTCNDETDTPRFRKLLRSIPGFNQQMQLRNLNESPWSQPQRKPQTKWIKTTASLRCIVPRLPPAPPTPAPGFAAHVFILCPVACPMFMLSTPGEELGFSFGIWRWKTEYWSILADQVLTTIKVLVPSFFLWYSICLQLYTEPRVVAVPI